MGSAKSTGDEILATVTCLAAWALAVWGIVRFRLAAIGKESTRIQAAREARSRRKTAARDPGP